MNIYWMVSILSEYYSYRVVENALYGWISIERVYSFSTIYSRFHYEFDECNEIQAGGKTVDLLENRKVDVIFGPTCSRREFQKMEIFLKSKSDYCSPDYSIVSNETLLYTFLRDFSLVCGGFFCKKHAYITLLSNTQVTLTIFPFSINIFTVTIHKITVTNSFEFQPE